MIRKDARSRGIAGYAGINWKGIKMIAKRAKMLRLISNKSLALSIDSRLILVIQCIIKPQSF